MLRQYFAAKADHPDVLLAMRVGDFYEFYGEDAEIAAHALEITLTAREDSGNKVPMAGVPFHSVEKYLARLISQGIKVALCDQLEDPKQAKGLVKRGVTRVLTPGTVLEDSMLESGRDNFLAALCVIEGRVGLAVLEPSTGEFAVTEIAGEEVQERLLQELARLRPSELLVGAQAEQYGEVARTSLGASVTSLTAWGPERSKVRLQEHLSVANLAGFGCEDKPGAQVAAAMILAYAEKNGLSLGHVDTLSTYTVDGFMRLDLATRRSLEITQNMQDGGKRLTLLWVLDQTQTSMGARLLRRWLEQPLLDVEVIQKRQDAVERLHGASMARGDLREELRRVHDIERLASRCSTGLAGPRDLVGLLASLLALPRLGSPLSKVAFGRLQELREAIHDHRDLIDVLSDGLVQEPPHHVRDGGVIRPGWDPELDKLRELAKGGKQYIAALEAAERVRTGISTLKVGFNSVFGYYLEVPKAQIAKVPEDYIRKQTTANAERYITAELKEHESQVLGAEEKAQALEVELFGQLRQRVADRSRELLSTARALAELDCLLSLAEVASSKRFVKPEIVAESAIQIVGGRHPVVEEASTAFVPNDLALGDAAADPRLVILTGPNMSGKSTYLRQTALIVLLAQIGSFVPAKSCRLGMVDRIFARIGARDELALGQSTFMVEMVESANILNHATGRSLVILDEVGRGTSTYDGLAIAWAMVERLAEIGALTLFATHYHQLNALAQQLQKVANFRVSVEEFGDEIVWTHRVLAGGTDRSYGIHVAKMAGVPKGVLNRAADILSDLEGSGSEPRPAQSETKRLQLTLFEAEKPRVVAELEDLDVNALTPVQALMLLDEWKRKFGTPG
ncbi:MAG: DNA mismatch repair protein MutS [Armatimonadetes bacterium]|nr:DNA mismatch repair protein MutS [Armatimonadota bacterium]